ncbi:MAG: hypothetical protein KTR32_43570 [Granulosicoccus sp.]|nr:hypothetical protein [Granulosicoccus sp.]
MSDDANINVTPLDRRDAVRTLLADRQDLLVVTGLGSPAYDVMAAGDHDLNVYLWGAMGGAAMVGLGLALAKPDRPVLVVTGDGEQLMGLGAMATIATQKPANLAVVVLDNGHYGETGMQKSHTGRGLSLAAVAKSCGFENSSMITCEQQLQTLAQDIHACTALRFASISIHHENPSRVLPSRDGIYIKNRFRAALDIPLNL